MGYMERIPVDVTCDQFDAQNLFLHVLLNKGEKHTVSYLKVDYVSTACYQQFFHLRATYVWQIEVLKIHRKKKLRPWKP